MSAPPAALRRPANVAVPPTARVEPDRPSLATTAPVTATPPATLAPLRTMRPVPSACRGEHQPIAGQQKHWRPPATSPACRRQRRRLPISLPSPPSAPHCSCSPASSLEITAPLSTLRDSAETAPVMAALAAETAPLTESGPVMPAPLKTVRPGPSGNGPDEAAERARVSDHDGRAAAAQVDAAQASRRASMQVRLCTHAGYHHAPALPIVAPSWMVAPPVTRSPLVTDTGPMAPEDVRA